MVGWHHRLSGHEFEQTPGDSEGQGSLSPWMLQTVKYDLATGHTFLIRGSDIKSMLRNFLKPNYFL